MMKSRMGKLGWCNLQWKLTAEGKKQGAGRSLAAFIQGKLSRRFSNISQSKKWNPDNALLPGVIKHTDVIEFWSPFLAFFHTAFLRNDPLSHLFGTLLRQFWIHIGNQVGGSA